MYIVHVYSITCTCIIVMYMYCSRFVDRVCAMDVCVQLLLEWGADIHIKNKISKTALELTRNADLKAFLTSEKNHIHRQ